MLKDVFLCFYFPFWSCDIALRLKHRKSIANTGEQRPLALVYEQNRQMLVARVNALAEKAKQGRVSVVQEMPASLAKAYCPQLQILSFDELSDFSILQNTAQILQKRCPLVSIDEEIIKAKKSGVLPQIEQRFYGITLNMRGMSLLVPDKQEFANEILKHFWRQGIFAQAAISEARAVAWALSRYGFDSYRLCKPCLVHDSKTKAIELVGKLPIESLRLSKQDLCKLREFGIENIFDILAIARKKISKHISETVLQQLDSLLTSSKEVISYVKTEDKFEERKIFSEPIEEKSEIREQILQLIGTLSKNLAQRGYKARSYLVSILFKRRNSTYFQGRKRYLLETYHRELSLTFANEKEAHLREILSLSIDSIVSDISKLLCTNEDCFKEQLQAQGIRVKASQLEHLQVKKIKLFSTQVGLGAPKENNIVSGKLVEESEFQADPYAGERLINSLVSRLGAKRVAFLIPRQAHLAEMSFSYVPASDFLAQTEQSKQTVNSANLLTQYTVERPSILFSTAICIKAISILANKAPAYLLWRTAKHKVLRAEGPERVLVSSSQSGEITNPQESVNRDYYKLYLESGLVLWVYTDKLSHKWFLQGAFT